MDAQRNWHSGSQVEFIDADESLDPAADAGSPTRFARLASVCRQRWFAPAVSGAMLLAAAAVTVGVLRTQTSFPLFGGSPNGSLRYALDGLGHYHLVGGRSSNFTAYIGQGPALGMVAIGGAVLLAASALWTLLGLVHRTFGAPRPFVPLASCAAACLAAGAVAATSLCEALEISRIPHHTWARGFWLFALGSATAVVAAALNVAQIGVDQWSPGRARNGDVVEH